MTAPMTSREDLAETIHKARWPADRQMAIIPFADEDRSGREYCFRIADAILTRAGPAQDAVRAAAERVCWFDWSDNDMDAVAAIDALRKAITSSVPSTEPRWEDRRIEETGPEYEARVGKFVTGRLVTSTERACTCHPDERIVPCQQKYAASECHSAWLLSLSSNHQRQEDK